MPTPRLVPRILLREPAEPLRIEMGDEPMEALTESIRELGILMPILVSPIFAASTGDECLTPDPTLGEQGREPAAYEIIDGHRRFYASGLVGLEQVPVMIFENADAARHAIMLHANVCREDVTPYEEGVQFLELAVKHQWSMDDLVRFFRKSENYINDRIDVVRKDQRVADCLRDRTINLGQAKEILKCDDPNFRLALLEQAAVHGATIQSLKVMRHNRLSEERAAQGELPVNASPQFIPGAVIDQEKCVWCDEVPEPGNTVRIVVHNHHQKDLEYVCKRVGLRALKPAAPGQVSQ